MPIVRQQTQVLWASTSNTDITTASANTSDVITLSSNCISAWITLKADNQGTPASGDTVDYYLLWSSGDPDANTDISDEYDTINHAPRIARLDTFSTDGGENPALVTSEINVGPQKVKLYAYNNSGGRTIRVSAQIEEMLFN